MKRTAQIRNLQFLAGPRRFNRTELNLGESHLNSDKSPLVTLSGRGHNGSSAVRMGWLWAEAASAK